MNHGRDNCYPTEIAGPVERFTAEDKAPHYQHFLVSKQATRYTKEANARSYQTLPTVNLTVNILLQCPLAAVGARPATVVFLDLPNYDVLLL